MTTENRSNARKPLAAAVVVGAVIIVVALAVFAYASPYLVLSKLRDAVQARDAQTIDRYVDYPALRTSLKQQVTQMLSQRVDTEKLQHPLAALGALVGMALVNPLVDAYATPDGVAALLEGLPPQGKPGETPPPVGEEQPQPVQPAQEAPSAPASASEQTAAAPAKGSAGYRDMSTFAVTYTRDTDTPPYSIVFHRRGWFSWQLDAVELAP
ncbi:DUF2939 domain-containing protein [Trinickia acidisoli]|uniref:DUF2939 domain-containing protein n=1 Tax=Trinickia acidisoli TaxID=2767482 RepID=UPI001A8F64DB|nr:DUF2939 domain-containing protein [Trinickia acidisoli]